MTITQQMLEAAMREAVRSGLVKPTAGLDEYTKTWDAMRRVLESAIAIQGETPNPGGRFVAVQEGFDLLTDAQRLEIIHSCCTECGTKGDGCQCWNDE